MTKPKKTTNQITPQIETCAVKKGPDVTFAMTNSQVDEDLIALVLDALNKGKLFHFVCTGPTRTITASIAFRLDLKDNVGEKVSYELQNNGSGSVTYAKTEVEGDGIDGIIIAIGLIYAIRSSDNKSLYMFPRDKTPQLRAEFKKTLTEFLGTLARDKYMAPLLAML